MKLFPFVGITILTIAAAQPPAGSNTPPLQNQAVQCCALLQYPTVFIDEKRLPYGLDGMAIDYLNLLQQALGFKCSAIRRFNDQDYTFTDCIYAMERCTNGSVSDSPVCWCQLGVGGWMRTDERYGRVDFLPNFLQDEVKVLVHIDNTSTIISGAFFLTTFTPLVWGLMVCLFVLFTFMKMLDQRFEPPDNSYTHPCRKTTTRYVRVRHLLLKSNVPRRLRKAAMSTAERMMGYGDSVMLKKGFSTRQWLLNFVIVLSGLFFVLTYEATMTASLVQEKISSKFRSVEDFRNCNIPVEDVCIPKGGAVESFWRNSISNSECNKGRMPRLLESYTTAVDKVVNKECKFLVVDGAVTGDAISGKHCGSLVVTGQPMLWGGASFITPRGSNLTVHLARTTLALRQDDMLMSLEQFYERRGSCGPVDSTSLSFQKLRIFFIAAFVVCFCIFAVMVFDPQTPPREEIPANDSPSLPSSAVMSSDGAQVPKEDMDKVGERDLSV